MRFFLILLFSLALAAPAAAQPESPDPQPYVAACEAGDGFACNYAYGLLQRADRSFWQSEGAIALLLRGCEVGSDRSCWIFERINEPNPYDDVRYDRPVYLPVALSGCEGGSTMACWQAAGFLETGNEAEREQAAALSRRACERGFADGCARLADVLVSLGRDPLDAHRGACYGNRPGRMRKQGDCEAVCDEGDAAACVELALMFERGRDGAQTMRRNARRADELFRRACDLGSQQACGH
ncbi:hypothetical protein AWH62_15380 [Maricaulis sp. W15]|uniref:sel1 repeat family protein n=1 Tax=Maricaulis sp. W15 TaxID=1772333 RepID=UPI000948C1DC|nr:sel1 repeat family protein [Maricaulis sp. W15]OLF79755.1 hypothetical protein AWH62_15380 [Maricaulis sp. W15]